MLTNAERLGSLLLSRKLVMATAESCTGGLIAKLMTDVAGSSGWFDCGIVTYSNEAKLAMLGVPSNVIARHGAVSAECAEAMARGLHERSGCGVCVAVTGIAGPGGGTAEKPVGLVYAGFVIDGRPAVRRMIFRGTRDQIRTQAAHCCLRHIISTLEEDAR